MTGADAHFLFRVTDKACDCCAHDADAQHAHPKGGFKTRRRYVLIRFAICLPCIRLQLKESHEKDKA